MYRINVLTTGKYNSVTTGFRYCFSKKTAMQLLTLFIVEAGCDVSLEKLIRVSGDIFAWTDFNDDKVFNYFFELQEDPY